MISIEFVVTIATLAFVFVMAGQLLNLEAGWGGMWDLGIAGLIAVGAYSYVLLTTSPDSAVPGLGLPFWAGMLGSAVITALVAVLIGWPALRLRGEYFLITTFAFAEIIRQVIIIQKDLTGGTFGLTSVVKPFEMQFTYSGYPYVRLLIVIAMAAALWMICSRIATSSYGASLRAARDNEPLAMAMGKSIKSLRLTTYGTVGLLCGFLVGPAYAWILEALVPSAFRSNLTFTIWAGLVIGGLGSRFGPIVGALLLTAVSEMVRLVDVPHEYANLHAAAHPFLVGVLLIALLRWRPDGLLSESGTFARLRRRYTRPTPADTGAATPAQERAKETILNGDRA
ncbi:branched-chain amino acid ABC transporter permease [Mycolicibacterium tokaiense]|uniref:Branched-chain amino acid ABC transporter permease protein n=1 Tax=Mycolicibacterium tokaiense TaxID=39695 RepID=A0A378TKV3_9MYCO|nr:branched-chain amino acid ABC transporter permease [Mycolicibacterium tokaiense]BBY85059.1 branched-chain amino acid ABC transporter permease [Mycolicibacterium tokaiense]STZ60433.1 branched-chain amino acid ABC transporter permease protein [Mycolicibacterium tokaiense]